jgi:type I restriction enzyme, S subunit
VSDLPSSWVQVPLGHVATSQLGRMLSAGRETGDYPKPYLRNRDVQWGHINVDGLPVMDFSPDNVARFLLLPGDVLVCKGGEVGRAAIWSGQLSECYYQKALHRVRTSTALLPEFLVYLLEHYARTKSFERYISGSTIAHLPQEDLRNLPVLIPPLAEQERVVVAIEEQFSRLDAGVVALQRAQQELVALNKAIILTAVPEIYPQHWQRTTVGQAGEVVLGRQRSPKYHKGPKMRRYLRVANVFEDRIDTDDIMSMHFDDAEFARYRLQPNDILLNEGQSPHLLGRPAMYRGDPPDVAFTNSLLRFRSGPSVLPNWALLVFRRHLHAKRFMRESQITTNIAHLSAGRFKTVEFPIPPINEQERIVASVEAQLSGTARTGAAIDAQQTLANALRSSILSAAFAGRLVAQDATDEPASALLKRVAAERTSFNGHKPARTRKPRMRREGVTA